MKLWRLDAGCFHAELNNLSDTLDYPGESRVLTNASFLLDHPRGLVLFDTGFPLGIEGPLDPPKGRSVASGVPLTEQLARLGYQPSDVTDLVLSHHHLDHTGQAACFATAKLWLGMQDVAELRASPAPHYTEPSHLAHWLSGGGDLQEVDGDFDLYGDGRVLMIALPGHTPGHHGLVVTLPDTGPLVLCVDTIHFAAQLAGRVPASNHSRADSLASIDRVKRLASNLDAMLIASHDPDAVDKLPSFPAFAT